MFLPSFWSAPCLRSTVASRCQGKDMTRQGAYHHFISPKPPDHFMWWEDTLEAFRQARIVNDSLYNATQQLLWHSNRAIGNQSIYIYIYTTFWVGRIVVGFNCFFFLWGMKQNFPCIRQLLVGGCLLDLQVGGLVRFGAFTPAMATQFTGRILRLDTPCQPSHPV